MPLDNRPPARAPKPEATGGVRITFFPLAPAQQARRAESQARWLMTCAAGLLLSATIGWLPLARLTLHGLSDYHYWAGREAYRRGEAQIQVQREWQNALVYDPNYTQVRLALARSYIDTQWLGGAIDQAQAVLDHPHDQRDGSLAYTYMGYSHYMLGETASGAAELKLAVPADPQNSLAQSVLERLERQHKLTGLLPS